MNSTILILQIIFGLLVVASVLLQSQDAGLGFFGGGGDSQTYSTKRGLEKVIFYVTIIGITGFVFLSLISLVI